MVFRHRKIQWFFHLSKHVLKSLINLKMSSPSFPRGSPRWTEVPRAAVGTTKKVLQYWCQEAFRREYLTSPLSHLRTNPNLVPPFPGLLPQLGDRSPFSKTGSHNPGGGSGARTPPTSSQSTPSSEFSSQQNWSFEEQFKQVIYKL